MDYRKINSHIILLSIILIVGIAISMIGRRVMLEKGFDTGTANLTFIIIMGVCAIVYMAILATLAHTIVPWIMKKLPNKQKTKLPIIPKSIHDEKEKISQQSIESIRQDSEKRYIEQLNAKISLLLEYVHLTMAPYITDDELARLDEYIKCFARKDSLPNNLIPIKPTKLKNPDMFHFGWNMAHYFEYDKQDIVPWLQLVFSDLSKLSFSTIKGKLYDFQTKKYTIPNIDDIPKFMSEKRS